VVLLSLLGEESEERVSEKSGIVDFSDVRKGAMKKNRHFPCHQEMRDF
jgi:hypothetical protein